MHRTASPTRPAAAPPCHSPLRTPLARCLPLERAVPLSRTGTVRGEALPFDVRCEDSGAWLGLPETPHRDAFRRWDPRPFIEAAHARFRFYVVAPVHRTRSREVSLLAPCHGLEHARFSLSRRPSRLSPNGPHAKDSSPRLLQTDCNCVYPRAVDRSSGAPCFAASARTHTQARDAIARVVVFGPRVRRRLTTPSQLWSLSFASTRDFFERSFGLSGAGRFACASQRLRPESGNDGPRGS